MIKIIPIFYRLASTDPKSNTIMLVHKSKMKGLLQGLCQKRNIIGLKIHLQN